MSDKPPKGVLKPLWNEPATVPLGWMPRADTLPAPMWEGVRPGASLVYESLQLSDRRIATTQVTVVERSGGRLLLAEEHQQGVLPSVKRMVEYELVKLPDWRAKAEPVMEYVGREQVSCRAFFRKMCRDGAGEKYMPESVWLSTNAPGGIVRWELLHHRPDQDDLSVTVKLNAMRRIVRTSGRRVACFEWLVVATSGATVVKRRIALARDVPGWIVEVDEEAGAGEHMTYRLLSHR